MENPYDLAHELARSLQASSVCRDVKKAQDRLDENPKYKEMLQTFARKRMEMETLYLQGKEPTDEQKEEMKTLMTAIQGVPAITEYLAAEERLRVMLMDLDHIIFEPVKQILGSFLKKEES
ncbi:YlbF family regulator [Thermoactinomyces mirandus]|uniref:YlbF family regulator n=1 Tax=Thermoactinomyces mirandus TaxID=2756294 RepID=A0A7W2ARN4_9BACL|nr:YlbF family regulator [Thermoactinomyces mirandus]MBA4602798.1 YlbF family regulator [Thermoactinomyces mirandus]